MEMPEENGYGELTATDMEQALFLATHIDNPCEVEAEPGKFENIRGYYLRQAREALLRMKEPNARRFLESKIKEYEDIG